MNLTKLLLMTVAGGVLAWVSVYGIETFSGGEVSTSVQFRSFVGVAMAFAIGGGSFINDRSTVWFLTNHRFSFALFSIPGMLWALPVLLFSPESTSLPVLAIIWAAIGGGLAYFVSTCLK